jgi:Flp pilus assembly protein TadD
VAQDRDRTLTHIETLLRSGRLDAAIAEYVRLVEEQPSDWNAASALTVMLNIEAQLPTYQDVAARIERLFGSVGEA